jgi:predicted ribosomally synthesized peptide with SipW-like signal peptide
MIGTLPVGLRGATGMRFLLLTTLAAGLLSVNAGRGTLAYFTTQVTSTGNQFTAGNLQLKIDDSNEANQASVGSSITFSDMKPGDVVYAPIKLTSAGTLATKYGIAYSTSTINASGDTNLADVLHITVKGSGTDGSGAVSTSGASGCNAANFGTASVWKDTVVADTALAAAGATLLDVASAARNIPTTGANTNFEVLCVKVNWPDGGAPPSLTTGDNAYNKPGHIVNTILSFRFDGLGQ